MNPGIIAAIAYGVLAVVGGIMGYMKAKSKISLLSGGVCGLLLILGGIVQLQGLSWGLILATLIAALLVIVFTVRLIKTRKLMPAGLMISMGLISVATMISQI